MEKLWLPEVGSSELFFLRFSSKDSGQTRDATDEPGVVSCSWSCSIS